MELRLLGRADYLPTWQAMKEFTAQRSTHAPDQLWICEHAPVFTQGVAGRAEHLRRPGDIPVVATDRGGQATYHGPGQVVAYPLIDLRRAGYFVKDYVFRLESAVIQTLAAFGVTGHRVPGAPGIYVRPEAPGSHQRLSPGAGFAGLAKIAALGIKVSRHCTYHGLALNVAMDLEPFWRVDPCGYAGLETTDLSRIGVAVSWDEAARLLAERLQAQLAP